MLDVGGCLLWSKSCHFRKPLCQSVLVGTVLKERFKQSYNKLESTLTTEAKYVSMLADGRKCLPYWYLTKLSGKRNPSRSTSGCLEVSGEAHDGSFSGMHVVQKAPGGCQGGVFHHH